MADDKNKSTSSVDPASERRLSEEEVIAYNESARTHGTQTVRTSHEGLSQAQKQAHYDQFTDGIQEQIDDEADEEQKKMKKAASSKKNKSGNQDSSNSANDASTADQNKTA